MTASMCNRMPSLTNEIISAKHDEVKAKKGLNHKEKLSNEFNLALKSLWVKWPVVDSELESLNIALCNKELVGGGQEHTPRSQ